MVLFDVGVYDSAKEVEIVLSIGGRCCHLYWDFTRASDECTNGFIGFFYLERKVATGLKGLDIVTAMELGISFYKVEEWDNTNL